MGAVALRVLVVEDDPAVAAWFARRLAEIDLVAIVEPTMAAALAYLARGPVEVIVCEYVLTEGSAGELAAVLATRGDLTPIVVVTAVARPLVWAALAACAQPVVVLPAPPTLLGLLEALDAVFAG
ncbi:MAG: response regulator [Myxococcales bacterium]|nr:response regulator [Myxococcales bacterium]